jgi:hypothetical protein
MATSSKLDIRQRRQQRRQGFFDQAVRKVIGQGARSENHLGNCAYCGQKDRRCAIGWLLSLEEREEILRRGLNTGSSVRGLIVQGLVDFLPEDADLLSDLQSAHDFSRRESFTSDFIERAERVADQYGLSKKELNHGKK